MTRRERWRKARLADGLCANCGQGAATRGKQCGPCADKVAARAKAWRRAHGVTMSRDRALVARNILDSLGR